MDPPPESKCVRRIHIPSENVFQGLWGLRLESQTPPSMAMAVESNHGRWRYIICIYIYINPLYPFKRWQNHFVETSVDACVFARSPEPFLCTLRGRSGAVSAASPVPLPSRPGIPHRRRGLGEQNPFAQTTTPCF